MRRTLAPKLLLIVVVGAVAGLVSSMGPTSVSATAELELFDAQADDRDELTWASREAARVQRNGSALLGPLSHGPHEVELDVSRTSLLVTVETRGSTDVVALADQYLLVVGADWLRLDDPDYHESLRAAELAAGVPSPLEKERPHVSSGEPVTVEPTSIALSRLQMLRSDALEHVDDRFVTFAGLPIESRPSPVRDGMLAAGAAGFGLLVRDRLRRSGRPVAVRTRLVSFDGLPGAVALAVVAASIPAAQLIALTTVPQSAIGLLIIALGIALARRSVAYGAVFVMWMWMLTPLVERIAAWADPDTSTALIQASPAIASVALLPAVVAAGWPDGPLGSLLGWLIPIGTIGLVIGADQQGVTASMVSAASFTAPPFVVIAAYRTMGRAELSRAAVAFLRAGGSVAALYAVIQWAVLPPWDERWLVVNFIRSFGAAEPFDLRVFGPLSSPAALGTLLVAAILVSVAEGRARSLSVALCSMSLLLTLHRASWVALIVSLIVMGVIRRWSFRTVARGVGLAAGLIGVVGLTVGGVRSRLFGLAAGLGDNSLANRIDNHGEVIATLDDRLFGQGFGLVGAGARFSRGTDVVNDSTLLDLFSIFGLPVGLALIGLLTSYCWRFRPSGSAPVLSVAGWSLLVGFAAVAPLLAIFEDPIGLWVALAALLAFGSGLPRPGELEPIAVVHDQLIQRGGAERVVATLSRQFPDATIVTTLFESEATFPDISVADIHVVSPIPTRVIGRYHRHAMPYLMTLWALTTVNATTVVCSSSAGSHAVRVRSGRKLVYCHTPPRWLYGFISIRQDLTATTRLAARLLAPPFRRLDRWSARSVDAWAANSSVTRQRIVDCYGAEPTVIFPTVGLEPGDEQKVDGIDPGYVLVVSRLLGYKNVDVVVDAVSERPDLPLVVVGDGPNLDRLRTAATANVRLLGRVDDRHLRWLYSNASVVVAVAYEDFGITPIEAARFGCPIVALRWGGHLDTVVPGVTGIFVEQPEASLAVAAIDQALAHPWSDEAFRNFADAHGPDRFARLVTTWVTDQSADSTPAGHTQLRRTMAGS